MDKSANVKKNTFLNMLKSVSSILFPMISFPYASRTLLTDSLGRVNFGNSIVSYFTLIAGLGINTYAIRECSKVKNDREKLEKLSSQLYSLNVCTTLVSYILLFILLIFATPLQEYRLLIVMQSLVIMMTTIGADWINNVMEDFKYITIRTIVFQAVSLLLLLLFIKSPDDYMKYAMISVISSGGANILNAIHRKKYCKIRFTKDIDVKKHIKPVLLLFSMLLAQTIYVNSDSTILGLIKGDTEVGLYSVSTKIYNIVQALVNSVTLAILPQLSYNFEIKNLKKVNELLRYGLNFTVTLGLPCIVGICSIAPQLIQVISGEQYLAASTSLRIMALALGCSFLGGFLGNMIMIPSGQDKICMISSIISAVLNLVLNLIFIPKFGLNAAATTTLISMLFGFIFKYPFVRKDISLGDKKTIFLGPIFGSVIIIPISLVITRIISNIFASVLIVVILSLVEYIVLLIIFKNDLVYNIYKKYMNKHFLNR